jgi:malic enzyme
MKKTDSSTLRDAALAYHEAAPYGKLSITPTKPLMTARDLALAYSPGVAFACQAIEADPAAAHTMTARGNLVAVITNGTAVLGLGAIGALASKPVMEGKAVLFKKFAGIDAIDIEIEERDPKKLIEIIAALEPSFGGINLEDIKAPECFEVESTLRERMHIPVFHDDQHGTAIIVAAAVENWLKITGRTIESVKLAVSGAGAAAMACLDLLTDLGLPVANITVSDLAGVVYKGRNESMDPRKEKYAQETAARTLAEIMPGVDMFLGLSAAGVVQQAMVKGMAANPLVLALANPNPEIMPEDVKAVRPDAIIATGRSDYTNQVNNVLCFPFIFRGALDVGATTINEAMKLAAASAIAKLAEIEPQESGAYEGETPVFGPDYLIPKPFDARLILEIAPAVAKAAMESGVATRPITDFDAYREKLYQFVYRSGLTMRPIFSQARKAEKRIVFAEGEEERVLRAVQTVVDEGLARPILIGRADVVERRCHPRRRAYRDAHRHHRHRRADGTQGPGRCAGLRHGWQLSRSFEARDRHSGPEAGCGQGGGVRGADPARRHFLHCRSLCDRRPHRRRNCGNDAAGRSASAPLRVVTKSGTAVAFQLRQPARCKRGENAGGAGNAARTGANAGGRGRNAGRCRPVRRNPQCGVSQFAPERPGQFAGDADARCRQHLLQNAARADERRLLGRPDPAGRRQTGAYPDAGDDGTRDFEHRGSGGGRCAGGRVMRISASSSTPAAKLMPDL